MKKLALIAALCLLTTISAVAFAAGEMLDLGLASISLDLESIGPYAVETGDSYSLDHNYDPMNADFTYTIYPASIMCNGSSGQMQIEVHKMSISLPLDVSISRKETSTGLEHCIREADMIPRGADIRMEPYTIDGRKGILATLNRGEDDRMYIAAYSPDQEEDGSGTIVCIAGSSLPWEITEGIFSSIKMQLA